MKPQEVLQDEYAPAPALLAVVLHKYEPECLDWEPEILREALEEDYGVSLTDLQSDKLQAAITVLHADHFEHRPEVFETCCHLFCNIPDDFETLDPLESEEIIAGVCDATIIRHERLDYGDEVRAYAGQVFYEAGFCRPPKLFPTAILPGTLSEEEKKQHEGTEEERNQAYEELFNARLNLVTDYLNSLKF